MLIHVRKVDIHKMYASVMYVELLNYYAYHQR